MIPDFFFINKNLIQSVRVQTTKAEKKDQKRKEKKEKMKLAEKQYKEDMARQKNMKMAELKEKLESLQETLGISELDIDPNMLKGMVLLKLFFVSNTKISELPFLIHFFDYNPHREIFWKFWLKAIQR